MQKIRVDLGDRSYNIMIGNNILPDIGAALEKYDFSPRMALLSNPTVHNLYGAAVSASLKKAGFSLLEIIIPDGEEFKNLEWVGRVYEDLLKTGRDRKSVLLALGGGVIGDITGFAASTYMRGIDYIQIPTTLLAQVDSSVGGKTGVNHPQGKNMIGSFWQPRLVWIDLDTLKSLHSREFLSGLAEVIKYGIIWDSQLFVFLEENREKIIGLDRDALTFIIQRSCEIKADVVSKDERESGLRAILNFGHTIGHAVETATGYKACLHGEAVAIGMNVEARLARSLGLLDAADADRITELIRSYSLPVDAPRDIDSASFYASMLLDKKAVAGELRFVLPERIGSVKVHKGIPPDKIRKACGIN